MIAVGSGWYIVYTLSQLERDNPEPLKIQKTSENAVQENIDQSVDMNDDVLLDQQLAELPTNDSSANQRGIMNKRAVEDAEAKRIADLRFEYKLGCLVELRDNQILFESLLEV